MSVGVSKDAAAGATRRLPSPLSGVFRHTLRTVVGPSTLKAVQERHITMLLCLSRPSFRWGIRRIRGFAEGRTRQGRAAPGGEGRLLSGHEFSGLEGVPGRPTDR